MPAKKKQSSEAAVREIRIVLKGLRGEESIAALCRREGIAFGELQTLSGATCSADSIDVLGTFRWLGGRDSNPDSTVQSRVSYH